MVILTVCDSPASTNTLWKPTSRLGGCPSPGTPRYTCTTSAPATGPVFVTDPVTVTGATAASGAFTETSVMSNVVYDRPNPKPYSGWMPCAWNQRYPISRPSEYRITGYP